MKLKPVVLAMMAVGLALPAAAADYRYLDGGVVDRDGSDTGVRMAGSGELTAPLAAFGEVVDAGQYEQLSAGLMFHTPFATGLDFNAGATLEAVDTGGQDDTGYGARAGLRWQVPQSNGLELNPEVRHVVVFNDVITSFRAGALFPVAPRFNLLGALQAGDDDRVELGMRYSFGTPRNTRPSY